MGGAGQPLDGGVRPLIPGLCQDLDLASPGPVHQSSRAPYSVARTLSRLPWVYLVQGPSASHAVTSVTPAPLGGWANFGGCRPMAFRGCTARGTARGDEKSIPIRMLDDAVASGVARGSLCRQWVGGMLLMSLNPMLQ